MTRLLTLLFVLTLSIALAGCQTGAERIVPGAEQPGQLAATKDGFSLRVLPETWRFGGEAQFSLNVSPAEDGATLVEIRADGTDLRAAFIELAYDSEAMHPMETDGGRLGLEPDATVLELIVPDAVNGVQYGAVLPQPDSAAGVSGEFAVLHVEFAPGPAVLRSASAAPATDASAIPDLSINPDTGDVSFSYFSQGDYDQNGEVNLADLTQIALHFQETGDFGITGLLSVVDGDSNGEINTADITPIAVNFGNTVSGWKLYGGDRGDFPAQSGAGNGAAGELAEISFGDLTGSLTTERLRFEGNIAAAQGFSGESIWLRPNHGGGEGVPSRRVDFGTFVEIMQNSYRFNDEVTEDSSYGTVVLHYPADPLAEVLYFSFSFNSVQQYLDFPVRGGAGDAGEQLVLHLPFNLGVANGTTVSEGDYSFSLSATKSTTAVDESGTLPVDERGINISDGEIENDGAPNLSFPEGTLPADWFTQLPGTLLDSGFHPNAAIVNQQAGDNECAPAAVSNSMKMLQNLNPTINQTLSVGIDDMKEPTAWDNGAPGGAPDNANAWWNKKKKWMEENADYPVETEIIKDKGKMDDVIQAIKDGKDVEMRIPGHVVMITGIAKIEVDGKISYAIEMAHDSDQDDDTKGCEREICVFDPESGEFAGEAWLNGKKFTDGTKSGGTIVIEDFTNKPKPVTTYSVDLTAIFPDPLTPGPLAHGHTGDAPLKDKETGEPVGTIPFLIHDESSVPVDPRVTWDWNELAPTMPYIALDFQEGTDFPFIEFYPCAATLNEPGSIGGITEVSVGIINASTSQPLGDPGVAWVTNTVPEVVGQTTITPFTGSGIQPESFFDIFVEIPFPQAIIGVGVNALSRVEVSEIQIRASAPLGP